MILTFNTNGNEKQKLAVVLWNDKTTTDIVYGGGKGGAKSFTGCKLIFGDALTYPGTAYGIARKTLQSMRRTTMPSIAECFEDWGLNMDDYVHYNSAGNYYECYNGSRVYLLDCSYLPSDPDYHRFGSLQLTRLWIEEGGEIAAKAKRNLHAAVGRWKNDVYNLPGKLLITCNPAKNWLYTEYYRLWRDGILPPNRAFIQALPADNKMLPAGYVEHLKANLSRDEIERFVYGNWEFDDDPRNLTTWDAICDAFQAKHVETLQDTELPAVSLSTDLARQGRDKWVTWLWEKHHVRLLYHESFSDLKNVEERLRAWETQHHVPRSRVVADSDGLGQWLGDYMKGIYEFKNGGRAYNTDKYADLKTECAYKLAELINGHRIYIEVNDPDIAEQIKDEILNTLKVENIDNDKQKRKLLSKVKVKELLGRSPDWTDPLIYGCVHAVKPKGRGLTLPDTGKRKSLV